MASTAPVTAHGDASPLNEHGAESIGSFNEHKQGTHRKRTHRTRYRLSESRSMPGKHDTAVKRPMISSRGSSLSIQWRERQSQSYISTHTHTHTHTHTNPQQHVCKEHCIAGVTAWTTATILGGHAVSSFHSPP